MTKQDKINKLTWEYFWIQKAREVFTGIICFMIPYFMGLAVKQIFNLPDEAVGTKFMLVWTFGLFSTIFLILVICMAGIVLLLIYMLLRNWINKNWEIAQARARKELK